MVVEHAVIIVAGFFLQQRIPKKIPFSRSINQQIILKNNYQKQTYNIDCIKYEIYRASDFNMDRSPGTKNILKTNGINAFIRN
jgi:hypothetical protein